MARAGLTEESVLAEAAQIVDEAGGVEGLTLAALADRLGVRVPSIYKHVNGMPGLLRGIMLSAKRDLAATLGKVAIGKSREDAVTAISIAYRDWALAHPGQYPATVHGPIPGDEEDERVSRDLVTIVFDVLAGYNLLADDAVDATRFFRAVMHGFVSLETGGGYEMPVATDRSFTRTVESIVTALATWPRT